MTTSKRPVLGLVLAGASSVASAQAIRSTAPRPPGAIVQAPRHIAGQVTWGRTHVRERALLRLRSTLRELREQGLEWRAADGGTLSAEHRATLQARLDEAQADYRRYRESAL